MQPAFFVPWLLKTLHDGIRNSRIYGHEANTKPAAGYRILPGQASAMPPIPLHRPSLSHYAGLAAGLIATHAGQAQIHYHNIDPDVLIPWEAGYAGADLGSFDVDGDGLADLAFQSTTRTYGVGLGMSVLDPELAFGASTFTSFFNSCTVNSLALRGPYGRSINAALHFEPAGVLLASTFPCGDVSRWAKGQEGFLPIRRGSGTTVRYGWLRIERLPGSTHVRLKDYALHEVPGVPVQAGNPGDTCLAVEAVEVEVLPTLPIMGTDLRITWGKVPQLLGYTVEVSKGAQTATYARARNQLLATSVPDGLYTVRVQAECPSGAGPWSEGLTFELPETESGPKGPKTVLSLRREGGSNPGVSWTAAAHTLHWAWIDGHGRVLAQGQGASQGRAQTNAAWPGGWYILRLSGEHPSGPWIESIRVWKP